MTHIHADDRNRLIAKNLKLANDLTEHQRHLEDQRALAANALTTPLDFPHAYRHSEGAGMDDWHDTLAPGFEDKPRPWRIEGPMFGAAVLMASATIFCLAVIGLLAIIFPGAFS